MLTLPLQSSLGLFVLLDLICAGDRVALLP